MAGTISRKLSNSFEGALAGGGDPATSPLYVFGPFLKLIIVAGVAEITFGATVWMAVFTVIMVSAMYRQVMTWVTDGSGGSGLSEEEFGSWAVKINAGITVIEYTLTFLVSMATLVTFIADRVPALGQTVFGFPIRTILAVVLTFVTAWLVNLGPKVSARAFGPATALILVLLWMMIAASIWHFGGIRLPNFDLRAFNWSDIHFTLGGYARILALMTGIEIFANLVAAYDGTRAERSKKAFGSLLIIMGTTSITMLIVGPAIFSLSDINNEQVSVFTQTMDKLLPAWASYAGTLIGIAVLLSACAAAAQGIQNLALGLRYRHYVAASLGQRNTHDVADKPVWLMAIVIALCFVVFGTHEETYLALYAAGVFILLSMTGWAATKRLVREMRGKYSVSKVLQIAGTAIAALLTSGATIVIFEERFFEGAWIYFLLVPALYFVFNYYRKHLGDPPSVEERLGAIISEQKYLPSVLSEIENEKTSFQTVVVPLNGSSIAEQVLPTARSFARSYGAKLELVSVINGDKNNPENYTDGVEDYLQLVTSLIADDGLDAEFHIKKGEAATEIDRFATHLPADLIIMTTRGKFSVGQILTTSVAQKVIHKTLTPILLIRPTDNWRSRRSKFKNIMVSLDGSEAAEQVLPFIRAFSQKFDSRILLLSVPEGSESDAYDQKITQYIEDVADVLRQEKFDVRTKVGGSGPARTIVAVSVEENIDLIMMASHGRGGLEREKINLGSVAEKVVQETQCPVFIVPLTRSDER